MEKTMRKENLRWKKAKLKWAQSKNKKRIHKKVKMKVEAMKKKNPRKDSQSHSQV